MGGATVELYNLGMLAGCRIERGRAEGFVVLKTLLELGAGLPNDSMPRRKEPVSAPARAQGESIAHRRNILMQARISTAPALLCPPNTALSCFVSFSALLSGMHGLAGLEATLRATVELQERDYGLSAVRRSEHGTHESGFALWAPNGRKKQGYERRANDEAGVTPEDLLLRLLTSDSIDERQGQDGERNRKKNAA
jgi:hypothetical protein